METRRSIMLACAATASLFATRKTLRAQGVDQRSERADLQHIFAGAGAVGAMAVQIEAPRHLILINAARAEQRFIPASTFKLPNSLIALETGVVKDENEIIPFGGKPQPNKAWERDMSLREALPMSNVAIFQEIARRIGLPRYREWLAKIDYGNRETGTIVERFWLAGPLRISAIEQARFAARLAGRQLPVSERSHAIVREICRLEQNGPRTLYGKTGWTGGASGIGWLTGWVEDAGAGITAFSLNIDMPAIADAPKRLAIAKSVLASLGRY